VGTLLEVVCEEFTALLPGMCAKRPAAPRRLSEVSPAIRMWGSEQNDGGRKETKENLKRVEETGQAGCAGFAALLCCVNSPPNVPEAQGFPGLF